MLYISQRAIVCRLIQVVLPVLTCCLLVGPALAVQYRTVALTGTQASGVPDGVVYSDLSAAIGFNHLGQAAFQGTLIGPGITDTNDTGVWSEGNGGLHLVLREDDPVPNSPAGVTFGRPFPPAFNDPGQTAWQGRTLEPDGSPLNTGVWSEGTGTLAPVAELGLQVPGMDPGVVFNQFGARNLIDNTGQTALAATVVGPGVDDTNNRVLWRGAGGSGVVLTRKGENAPGTEAGVNFSDFHNPHIKGAGHLAVQAILTGPGVDSTNDTGLWTADATGNINLVARIGSLAPGTDPGVRFDVFGPSFQLNDIGRLALQAELQGAGVDSTNNTALWAQDAGGLNLLAREGTQAPGLDPGIKLGDISTGISFNNAGAVGFHSLIIGPGVDATNDSTLWVADADTLTLIARTGDPAPDTNPGTVFDSLIAPTVNNAGQLAFSGTLSGAGIDDSNDRGIWAQLGHGLELIAREGDLLDVGAGDTRTIDLLGVGQLNDLGQTLFYASFTDGSEGIFVATVPEPTSGMCLISGLLILLKRSRE